jgi:DNA-binding transcriptional ArsR family regulator
LEHATLVRKAQRKSIAGQPADDRSDTRLPAPASRSFADSKRAHSWRLLTNHALVLLLLVESPDVRVAQLAERTGLSERAVRMIIRDLVDAGYAERRRCGRMNRYRVNLAMPLRQETVGQGLTIAAFVALFQ